MRRAMRPWWVWAVHNGTVVTVVCLVFTLDDGLTRERVLLAFAVGAVMGPLLGLLHLSGARRERANLLAAVPELHGLDPRQQLAAERAARRGPVPTDPAVRLVAAEIARYRLAQSIATRTTGVVSAVLLAVLLIAFAVVGDAWQWPIAAVFAALAVDAVLAPRRRSARVVTLAGDVPEPAAA